MLIDAILVTSTVCFLLMFFVLFFFFFKQKTAYEMRISDWSSDVCSSDLRKRGTPCPCGQQPDCSRAGGDPLDPKTAWLVACPYGGRHWRRDCAAASPPASAKAMVVRTLRSPVRTYARTGRSRRSEEHTSELQSLMRTSYAVFCLQKKKQHVLLL